MPLISSPNVTAFSAALPQSNRCLARGGVRQRLGAQDQHDDANGTFTAKNHCHPATERMPAAMVGPNADEVEPTMTFTPKPRPSSFAGR